MYVKYTIPAVIDDELIHVRRSVANVVPIWTMQSNYHNLPMIDKILQSFSKNYKATGCCLPTEETFLSANIATSYPKEAEVNSQHLLAISNSTNSFLPEISKESNQVNFLTWERWRVVPYRKHGSRCMYRDGR